MKTTIEKLIEDAIKKSFDKIAPTVETIDTKVMKPLADKKVEMALIIQKILEFKDLDVQRIVLSLTKDYFVNFVQS